jgi:hypothetical protein
MRRSATATPLALLGSCAVLWVALGCTTEARLREAGPTPYVRCLAAPPPDDRTLHAKGLGFALKGAVLNISGIPKPAHLVVFSGAGFGAPPTLAELTAAAGSGADLFIMLGGLGGDDAAASATAAALGKLPRPLIFVAGGRDSLARVHSAISALPANAAVIDATSLREVRIGTHSLIPIAGAEDGRYAVNDDGCGFGLADLKARAAQLGKAAGPRWLLAWNAPASFAGAESTAEARGIELGSPTLAEFARRIGVAGGLYAWPQAQLGLAKTGAQQLVVPRLFGPIAERPDGSRSAPGFARVELGDAGLRLVR